MDEGRHLPVELLGLLAHVDDVVLAEHLAGVGVVPAGPAQGLACSTQCREGGKLGDTEVATTLQAGKIMELFRKKF